MQTIKTVEELKNKLEIKTSKEVLLDVRTPQEFASGHIPGAINLNINQPDILSEIEKLDHDKIYIIYCRSGGRSQMASMIMEQKGLKVINSIVGFAHWESSGLEVYHD
jgi:phage shock protein E